MTKCPQCGYQENVQTKLQTNVMNEYVDEKTGKPFGIFNSEEPKLNIPANKTAGTLEVTVIRKDIYEKSVNKAPQVPQTPKTPTPEVKK